MTAYEASLITLIAINVILTLSLNLIAGLCGQPSLGHAGFLAVGAYATALLAKAGFGVPATLLVSVIAAGAVGTLVGFCSLRVRDDFLAIATMGAGFLIVGIVRTNEVLGGEIGISQIPVPDLPVPLWLAACLSAVVVCALCWWTKASWLGYAFDAVASDEQAARGIGIDASHYKLVAFAIGTAMAGLGGTLYAYYLRSVSPEAFGFPVSVMILAMVVVGGKRSLIGSVLAATLLTLLPEWVRFVNDYKLLVFGVMLFAIMRFLPTGIYPSFVEMVRRMRTSAGTAR